MKLTSGCCDFEVGYAKTHTSYCYVCRTVHAHRHLDLREFKTALRGRIKSRHRPNLKELKMDENKIADLRLGMVCASLAWEVEACCAHGELLTYEGEAVALHTCSTTTSVSDGLDFTVDVCGRRHAQEVSLGDDNGAQLSGMIDAFAGRLEEGAFVKFNPSIFSFERTVPCV
jgi:hypothetical protein